MNDQANPIVVVSIEEVNEASREAGNRSGNPTFDFRTGEPFDLDRAKQRLAAD